MMYGPIIPNFPFPPNESSSIIQKRIFDETFVDPILQIEQEFKESNAGRRRRAAHDDAAFRQQIYSGLRDGDAVVDTGRRQYTLASACEKRNYILNRARREHEEQRLRKLYPKAMLCQAKESVRIIVNTLDICVQKAFPDVPVLPDELKLEILNFLVPRTPEAESRFTTEHQHPVDQEENRLGQICIRFYKAAGLSVKYQSQTSQFLLFHANVLRRLENDSSSMTVNNRCSPWRCICFCSTNDAAFLLCIKIIDHMLRECHVTRKFRFEICIDDSGVQGQRGGGSSGATWELHYGQDRVISGSFKQRCGYLVEGIQPAQIVGYAIKQQLRNYSPVFEATTKKLKQSGYLVERVEIDGNPIVKKGFAKFVVDVYYEPCGPAVVSSRLGKAVSSSYVSNYENVDNEHKFDSNSPTYYPKVLSERTFSSSSSSSTKASQVKDFIVAKNGNENWLRKNYVNSVPKITGAQKYVTLKDLLGECSPASFNGVFALKSLVPLYPKLTQAEKDGKIPWREDGKTPWRWKAPYYYGAFKDGKLLRNFARPPAKDLNEVRSLIQKCFTTGAKSKEEKEAGRPEIDAGQLTENQRLFSKTDGEKIVADKKISSQLKTIEYSCPSKDVIDKLFGEDSTPEAKRAILESLSVLNLHYVCRKCCTLKMGQNMSKANLVKYIMKEYFKDGGQKNCSDNNTENRVVEKTSSYYKRPSEVIIEKLFFQEVTFDEKRKVLESLSQFELVYICKKCCRLAYSPKQWGTKARLVNHIMDDYFEAGKTIDWSDMNSSDNHSHKKNHYSLMSNRITMPKTALTENYPQPSKRVKTD